MSHEFNIKNGFISQSGSTVNGQLIVTGDVTGLTFSKSGGTSTQFLKADGSVDTNTYVNSGGLSTAISTEVSTRSSVDTSLSTAISTEISSRISGDTSLSTAIQNYLPLTTIQDTKDYTGFLDGNNIAVTYNWTNKTITLDGASLSYYFLGVKRTLGNGLTWTSTGHTNTNGSWFLSSTDGINFTWSPTSWVFSDLMVAYVYYQSTSATSFAIKETHGIMDWKSHEEFHTQIGTYLVSGGKLTANTYLENSAIDTSTTPGFDAAVIKDEDCQTNVGVWTQGTYTTMYVSGNTSIFNTGNTTPFIATTNTYIQVNNPTTGTMTVGVNSRWYNVYQILMPTSVDTASAKYRMIMLQPQTTFTSLASAKAEDINSLYFGGLSLISPEFVVYSRITYVTSNGDNNIGRCRISTGGVSYVTGNRVTQVSISGVGSTDHLSLSNLTWISSGHIGDLNTFATFDGSGNASGVTISSIVDITGNQNITGIKTFSSNVGIGLTGTTLPATDLDVRGLNVPISSNVGQFGNLLVATTDSYNINVGGSIVLAGKYKTGSDTLIAFGTIHGKKENAVSDNNAGYLAFETASNSAPLIAERMRISSLGYVGINTIIPSTYLDVRSNVSSNNILNIQTTGNTISDNAKISFQGRVTVGWDGEVGSLMLYSTDNSKPLIYKALNTEIFRVLGNQTFGIGTIAADKNFQIYQQSTGPGTVTTNATNSITGTTTLFLNTFKIGDSLTILGETRTIQTITSNTNLTVTATFTSSSAGQSYTLTPGNRFNVLGNGNVALPAQYARISIGAMSSDGDVHIGSSGAGDVQNGQDPEYGFYVAYNAYREKNGYWYHSRNTTVSAYKFAGGYNQTGFNWMYSTNTGTTSITWTELMKLTNTGVLTATSFNSITGLGSSNPLINGTVAIGTSTLVSRQDHIHPSDTTKSNGSYYTYNISTVGWTRIAQLTNPSTGQGYGIISITNLFSYNAPSPVIFSFGTSYRDSNKSFITQLGAGADNLNITQARIVSPTLANDPYYIEVYYNGHVSGNTFYITLSNTYNVTLNSGYTVGTIPSNYNTKTLTFRSYSVVSEIVESTITGSTSSGSAPFVVASTKMVNNLNAQYLNGQLGSYYQPSGTTLNNLSIAQLPNLFLASSSTTGNIVPSFRSIVSADIPTLNQNTTGSAATLTTYRTIFGQPFNGSANVTGQTTATDGLFTGKVSIGDGNLDSSKKLNINYTPYSGTDTYGISSMVSQTYADYTYSEYGGYFESNGSQTANSYGIYAISTDSASLNSVGVYGKGETCGVEGHSTNYGVYGHSDGGYGGNFESKGGVAGNFINITTNKAGANFTIYTTSEGTFNTTSIASISYGIYNNVTTTRSNGSNTLTNIGIYSNATGATINNSAVFYQGDVLIGHTSNNGYGKLQLTGNMWTSGQITVGSDPTANLQVATKQYVDGKSVGLTVYEPVKAATTGNTSRSGSQIIDGVSLTTNDRVLVKNQNTPSENGIYLYNSSTSWSRSTDMSGSTQVINGGYVLVTSGTTNASSGFILSYSGTFTINSTSMVWSQFSQSSSYTASSGITIVGNDFRLISKTISGVELGNSLQALITDNTYLYMDTLGYYDGSNETTIYVNATPINEGGKIVARNASGGFSASYMTGTTSNSDSLGGFSATNYTRKDLTGLGMVGNVTLDDTTNTALEWSNLPVGYSKMMNGMAIGLTGGTPTETDYGYFTKIANRNVLGGWSGLWIAYNTLTSSSYFGTTYDSGVTASWSKIWTDSNDGADSGLNADLWDDCNRPINFGTNIYGQSVYESGVNLNNVLGIGESHFVQSNKTNGPSDSTSGYIWVTAGGDTDNRGVQFFNQNGSNRLWNREMTNKTWKEFVFKEDDLYFDKNITTTGVTITGYTLVLLDNGRKIDFNNSSNITVTVPNSSVGFPTGTQIIIKQLGTGSVYFSAGSGVTIHSQGSKYEITGQYGVAQLIYEGSNIWTLFGNLI